MRVTIQLFAQLADLAETRTLDLEVPPHATAGDALEAICAGHPALAPMKDRIAMAVNDAYVKPDTPLVEGAQIAMIPPVSGG